MRVFYTTTLSVRGGRTRTRLQAGRTSESDQKHSLGWEPPLPGNTVPYRTGQRKSETPNKRARPFLVSLLFSSSAGETTLGRTQFSRDTPTTQRGLTRAELRDDVRFSSLKATELALLWWSVVRKKSVSFHWGSRVDRRGRVD